ncbi:ABC transporter permease [Marinibaculum pumilum]|uniref:ABC transporter permease n=1 Tax=Marinibaculum pumilum TaxID=1766165 RepID=A0ABV7L530_9PROT
MKTAGRRRPAGPALHAALRAAPLVTAALLTLPVAVGTAGIVLPFGWLDLLTGSAGRLDWSRPFGQAVAEFLAAPGIWTSLRVSLTSALAATLISLLLVLGLTAAAQGSRLFALLSHAISPLLAVPHAAMAAGLAFLVAPSGWLFRLASPWATGLERPPDLLILHDPAGLALTAGLVVKEVPFLFLMTLAALPQTDAARRTLLGRSLGYGRIAAWCAGVAPQLLRQLRLPVLAVLAYGLSTVDMAVILGPTTPPPLAVRCLLWLTDPDLTMRATAAVGAIVLLAATAAGAAMLWLLALLARMAWRWWIWQGLRLRRDAPLRRLAVAAAVLVSLLGGGAMLVLLIWSVAGPWRFPEPLPDSFTLTRFAAHLPQIHEAVLTTLGLALATSGLALLLTVGCLENEARGGGARRPGRALWLLYLPLILPQMSFLFGLQAVAAALGLVPGLLAVAWAQLLFVLPYTYLSLADPWHAWDRRFGLVARGLGAGPVRVLLAVKLPMLLAPLLTAAAVGIAVSTALYLPTALLGAGRVSTLTTEAVTLASGQDRRLLAVFAVLQAVVPFLAFGLARLLPAALHPAGRRSAAPPGGSQ